MNDAHRKYGADAIKLLEPPELTDGSKPITVDEYAETFLKREQASGNKQTTYQCYESNLRVHIRPALGALEITALDYSTIANFLAEKSAATYSSARFRVKRKKEKRPAGTKREYSKDALRLMAMTLRALMAEAVRDKLIQFNPVSGLAKFYRKRKKEREVKRSDVFTMSELHTIEDKVAERYPEYWEFVLAMSREGMRIGEAMALLVVDIDFGRGTINIDKNIPAGTGELEDSAKTEYSEREIEFWSEDFRMALLRMLARRKEEAFAARRPMPDQLFCEPSGRFVNYGRFVDAWKRCQQLAEVKYRPPHALRHTWASHMIESGEDIASVSKHMGHANPGVTLGLYTHFLPGKRRQVGNVLDRQRPGLKVEERSS